MDYEALEKRIDKCEQEIHDLKGNSNKLELQQAKMDTKLDYITEMVKDLKTGVANLAEKPGRRWDTLTNAFITAAISFAVSGLLGLAIIWKG